MIDKGREIVEIGFELDRVEKLSTAARLKRIEVDISASDLALRLVLEVIEKDMTDLFKRVEKLEKGMVNIPTEYDPIEHDVNL